MSFKLCYVSLIFASWGNVPRAIVSQGWSSAAEATNEARQIDSQAAPALMGHYVPDEFCV
ncbi:MAG: hypothetical protein ING44_07235 [Telmatospirillum sp.]|nr:hypothetical protein [Telmatospirillum sp.]